MLPVGPPDPAARPATRPDHTKVSVEARFFGELNDFLPPDRRDRPIRAAVATGTTVKDLAESLGVPHTEIDVIVVNSGSVDFAHRLEDGDQVRVYPVLSALDLAPPLHLRPPVSGKARFVLDIHLGRLARYLRLLGFDAVWRNDATDVELVAISRDENRILLTRDRGLLKRSIVTNGYYVRETARRHQIVEVLRRFKLFDAIEPFGRCLECNGLLEAVSKAEVEHRLPPRTRLDHDEFQRCAHCGRVYWKGTHYDRLCAVVDSIRSERPCEAPSPSPQSLAEAALEFCGRGWSVIPLHTAVAGRCSCRDPSCPAPGKHPRVAWERFMRGAAPREGIVRWWRRWPQANVGVVTGQVSGLVVLDVDPRHGGGEALAVFEAAHGALPRTVESLTGGGGQHIYFRHPGNRVPSRPLAQGLDIKGDGGLVVLPPSVHATGRAYVWETGSAPGDVALAEVPASLCAMMLDTGGAVSSARRTLNKTPPRTETERREFAELWTQVGVRLRPGDQTYLCPFHADHHPSLHIDWDGCRFYCFGCARGGGPGRLRRLVGTHEERPRGAVEVAHMSPGVLSLAGGEEVDVVGASSYQDALLELTGGRRHYGGVRIVTVARLVPEPDNAADPGAIAVTIAGTTVGYLSRGDAARHREAIATALEQSGEATCAATIIGGWEREHGDVGRFGVRLSL